LFEDVFDNHDETYIS